jgi:hypothetical protein
VATHSSRFIDCPNCDGGQTDRGRCFICGGDGELEIEALPITLEDLEELQQSAMDDALAMIFPDRSPC